MVSKRIAFVFPGQGSQSVGMLGDFVAGFPQIQTTFQEASRYSGYDMWALIQQGPAEKLDQTTLTQPALLTASIALWRLWQEQKGATPIVAAGNSLGEYSALVCADALSFKEALTLVAQRASLMQHAVPLHSGAMAAIIGLTDEQVIAICSEASSGAIVSATNFNAPGQVVIAGNTEAVQRAMAKARQAGARLVKLLPISVPSHCALMRPAAEALQIQLEQAHWQMPAIPIIHNVSASWYNDLSDIQRALYQQLFLPVRWAESIQKMVSDFAITHIIECGPGKVLAGLNKRIVNIPTYTMGTPHDFQSGLELCST